MSAVSDLSWFLLLIVCTLSDARRNCTQIGDNPCHCDAGKFGRRIICPKITSELNLNFVVKCVNRFHVSEFVLDNSELRYINQDTFQGTSYKRIHIRDTTLSSLTDTRQAFKGLENQLQELVVEKGSFVSDWNWSTLKDLTALRAIEVVNSDYVYATGFEDLSLPKLEKLNLTKNGMTGIAPKAFANLDALRELHLRDNEIDFVERGMFPKSPAALAVIDLSNNLLRSLREDVFSGMPKLKVIYLNGNQFRSIEEKVFAPVWGQLSLFDFRDTPLICDCRLKWVANAKSKPETILAVCSSPEDLKGSALSALKASDLWC